MRRSPGSRIRKASVPRSRRRSRPKTRPLLRRAALTLAMLRAPEAPIALGDGRNPRRRARLRVVDVLPRLPDHVRCFALMAIPAVATTMAIIFLRTATNGVRSSIYVVYLSAFDVAGGERPAAMSFDALAQRQGQFGAVLAP
jgi:hypothetical protein